LIKRLAIAVLGLLALGVAGFAALAWRSGYAPIEPRSAAGFAPGLIADGEKLSGAGDCAICHTAKDGKPFAGGLALETTFGVIYSLNITPDVKTGIGAWSEEAFARAMREGVARDGSHLFPAFPYNHFTKATDGDIAALYAFLMTREPVSAPPRDNALLFPLNIRALQEGWKLLFFRAGRFSPDINRSPDWNRGAYLAEGLGHCGACHTPRNFLGAEKADRAYTGAMIDGELAPALTEANYAPVPWGEDELFAYLRNGTSRFHGRAGGPMAAVVHEGLEKLPDADIRALAVYFADIGKTGSHAQEIAVASQRATDANRLDLQHRNEPGANLYVAACASCHYNSPGATNPLRPSLAAASLVNAPDPTDLIRVMLGGRHAQMPAFGKGLDDADVALIASYLRKSRTGSAPWPHLDQDVARIRAEDGAAAARVP
jgi:mono/diheme cytochrome c family protein